ncbi:MAG: hypothetical protein ACK5D5_05630 [Bacteroidota bacterium]|jgi:uncharacterized protein (TIGR02145 family)
MKNIFFLFSIVTIFSLRSQTFTYCPGDSIYLGLPSYTGTLQWQESSDSLNWSNIPGATFSPYGFIFTSNKYYRAAVTAPNCNPVYSSVKHAVSVLANTVSAASSTPTLCINTALTNIIHTTTGATGIGTATGLPAGVTASWNANTITISGTPTASGTFNYSIPLTGGCGSVNATGTITVTPANTIALTSAGGTNAQTKCVNTAITNITYATTGATGATVTGLPTGVTGNWASNVVTISGTPTLNGNYTYTVTMSGGCTTGTNTATGTITVNNIITLTSAAGTNAQTVCINSPITNITYSTSGATGATFSGLPTGVSGNWASNVVTISGTPSVSGNYTFTVTMTGGCAGGTNTTTGTFTVNTLANCYPAGSVFCNGPTAIVDVTNPTTGKTWMDRNLGATQVATSSTDANSYGDLYQWGRGSDGHQCRTSATTSTLSSTDQPGNGNFISTPNTPYDWRSPQNVNLWQGVNGVNNPCPSGYRLPTFTELDTDRLSWSSSNSTGAFASPLKWPLAGGRAYNGGALSNVGTRGEYWSSTVSSTSSRDLYFNSSTASLIGNPRAWGYSVRCIKN